MILPARATRVHCVREHQFPTNGEVRSKRFSFKESVADGTTVPLHDQLAPNELVELRAWLADKAAAFQDAASDAPTVLFDPQAVKPSKSDSAADAVSDLRQQAPQTLQMIPLDFQLVIFHRAAGSAGGLELAQQRG